MRNIKILLLLLVLAALLVPETVKAVDYVQEAANALKNASVFVYPETAGTDKSTVEKLSKFLIPNDQIVLVMLPADAETGTNLPDIATSLSQKLGDKYIIGLAVGRKVIGHAKILDAGVAVEQMERADYASQDPITALQTFSLNIHAYQAAHPTPIPPIPIIPEKGQFPWLLLILVAVFVALMMYLVVALRIRTARSQAGSEKTQFDVPGQVRSLLTSIVNERLRVNDGELGKSLYQMAVDIERYFDKSSNDKQKDARIFAKNLGEVYRVLLKYIDVQNYSRYYNFPERELRRGKESIEEYAKYVLASIRAGNEADLVEYKVDTAILNARRSD